MATHTHAYTHTHTLADESDYKKPGAPTWFKNRKRMTVSKFSTLRNVTLTIKQQLNFVVNLI